MNCATFQEHKNICNCENLHNSASCEQRKRAGKVYCCKIFRIVLITAFSVTKHTDIYQ